LCNLAVEVCGVGKQHAREIAELRNWEQVILTREIDEGQREEAQIVGVKEEGAGNKVWMLVKPGAQELPQQALTAVGAFFLLCGKMRGELPQEDSCVEVKARSQHPKRERERGKHSRRARWLSEYIAKKAGRRTRTKVALKVRRTKKSKMLETDIAKRRGFNMKGVFKEHGVVCGSGARRVTVEASKEDFVNAGGPSLVKTVGKSEFLTTLTAPSRPWWRASRSTAATRFKEGAAKC